MGHYSNKCKKKAAKVKEVSGEQYMTKAIDL